MENMCEAAAIKKQSQNNIKMTIDNEVNHHWFYMLT